MYDFWRLANGCKMVNVTGEIVRFTTYVTNDGATWGNPMEERAIRQGVGVYSLRGLGTTGGRR